MNKDGIVESGWSLLPLIVFSWVGLGIAFKRHIFRVKFIPRLRGLPRVLIMLLLIPICFAGVLICFTMTAFSVWLAGIGLGFVVFWLSSAVNSLPSSIVSLWKKDEDPLVSRASSNRE